MTIRKECDRCSRKFRYVHKVEGKKLCWHCANSSMKNRIPTYGRGCIPLEEALKKVRNVNGSVTGGGSLHGVICTPRCLVGKKVRLILIEGGEE